jgi:hypothetical protein
VFGFWALANLPSRDLTLFRWELPYKTPLPPSSATPEVPSNQYPGTPSEKFVAHRYFVGEFLSFTLSIGQFSVRHSYWLIPYASSIL